MSVAKTWTLVPFWAASTCSISSIATVYASSPVAQPVTQARSGWSGGFSRMSAGITSFSRNFQASGSRKKPVMAIPGVQHRQDGAEVFGELLVGRSGCGGATHVGMLDESQEDLGHPLHGQ